MTNNDIDGSRCCVGSTCQEQGLKAEQLLVEPWHESRSILKFIWDVKKKSACLLSLSKKQRAISKNLEMLIHRIIKRETWVMPELICK